MKKSAVFFLSAFLLLLTSGCDDGSDSRSDVWDTPTSDCFWQVGLSPGWVESENHGWADLNNSYRAAVYVLPDEASCLTIENRFPHARYISFSSYYALGGTIDNLMDKDILPDTGATNPFVAGNSRNDPARNYTLTIKADNQANCPSSSNIVETTDTLAMLMYRIYRPDAMSDALGDEGLPRVTLYMADGSFLQGQEACDALNLPLTPSDKRVEWYTEQEYADLRGAQDPAPNPPVFRANHNFEFHKQCDFGGDCTSVPEVALKYPFPNPHYLYSFISRNHGEVLILRGKLPSTPKTFENPEGIVESRELRYWSLCNQEYYSQRSEACLFDEQIQVNEDSYYTIAVSLESDMPDNATADCGVSYLSWSTAGDGFGIEERRENNVNDGFLLLRNLIPAPDFPHAAPSPDILDQEEETMGDYLTKGRYFTKAEFEGLGCNPWLALPYDEM
ncbi:hypothetical protein ACFL3Y_01770 [Pseudomonadota bacterium]